MPFELWSIPIFIAITFTGIMFVISRVGGWNVLAREFPSRETPTMSFEQAGFQGIQLRRGMGYNGCAKLIWDDEYLHFEIWPVLRIFHPRLSIPWEEISAVRTRRMLSNVVECRFQSTPGYYIAISPRTAERVFQGRQQLISDDHSSPPSGSDDSA